MKGLRASDAAGEGFRGDVSLISKPWLAGLAGHDDVEVAALEPSGQAPSASDVGFKPFPIARQAQNAVFAFQRLLERGIAPARIDSIEVRVSGMNVPLLSRPALDDDRLSRLCNMSYQLAAAALAPDMLDDAERAVRRNTPIADFARRVTVKPSDDLEAHLPNHWAARVEIIAGRERFEETAIRTPLDHDAPDLAHALGQKWRRLVSAEHLPFLDAAKFRPAALWQMIERRVSMLADSGSHSLTGEG
jgi:2-methylcitrate dehydratase PrpD